MRVLHGHSGGDVIDAEQLLDVHLAVAHVLGVDAYEVGAGDVDAAVGKHPFLEGHVLGVHLFVGGGAAFHLVDGVAASGLAEDIDGAEAALVGEGGLADVVGAVGDALLGALEHGLHIEVAGRGVGRHFGEGTEQSHGEVAHLVAGGEPCLRGGVNHLFSGFVRA